MMDDNAIRPSPYLPQRSLQYADKHLLKFLHLNGKFIYRIFSSWVLFRNLSDCCLFGGPLLLLPLLLPIWGYPPLSWRSGSTTVASCRCLSSVEIVRSHVLMMSSSLFVWRNRMWDISGISSVTAAAAALRLAMDSGRERLPSDMKSNIVCLFLAFRERSCAAIVAPVLRIVFGDGGEGGNCWCWWWFLLIPGQGRVGWCAD